MAEFNRTNIISEFQKLGIPIFTQGQREFELSVATGNFLYRYYVPTWVVRPRNGEDVATTVRAANSLKVIITVKNGGHSYAGFSNASTGILLDMSSMKAVTINDSGSGKLLTCSAGALWGDVYNELARDKVRFNKWIANGGRCPAVGVTGFILGGGFGPFSRSLGIGSDQLVQAELVTVDGEVVTVSDGEPKSKEGDLFWALRGCGGGNFGIVTKLKIDIKPLVDEWVVAGRLVWTVAQASLDDKSFTELMTDFYTAKWDDKMTIDSTWSCDLTRATDERPFATRFITYYDGTKDCCKKTGGSCTCNKEQKKWFNKEIDENLKRTGTHTPPEPEIYEHIRKQIKRRSIQEPSTLFLHETLWSQWSEETRRSLPTEKAYTLYSSWVIQNDRPTIDALVKMIPERVNRFRKKFGGSGDRGTFEVTWIHIGGKISEAPDVGSYPWRAGNYCVYILVRWHEKWLMQEMGAFFDETKKEFKKHAMEKKASYVNFGDRRLDGWQEAYYGRNLGKLRAVYKTWVDERMFEGNKVLEFPQSIGDGPSLGGPRGGLRGAAGGNFRGYIAYSSKPEETEAASESEPETLYTAVDTLQDLMAHWQYFVPPRRGYDHFALLDSGSLPRC